MFAIPHECMRILLISADELEIDFCNWLEYLLSTMLFIITIDVPFCPFFFYVSGNDLHRPNFELKNDLTIHNELKSFMKENFGNKTFGIGN